MKPEFGARIEQPVRTHTEAPMANNRSLQRIILLAVPVSVFLTVTCIGLLLGGEPKPWWERAWGSVAGGSLGAILGIGFFIFVGAIGWVSGPLFGAVGLLGLAAGGALGGLGLGSIVDMIRNPQDFRIHMLPVVGGLLIGLLAAYFAYIFLVRKFRVAEAAHASCQDDHE